MEKHINETVPFWTDQISVLVQREHFYKIIPTKEMTRCEQLNAITRLCIYLIILMYMFKYDNFLQLPIIVIIFVVILNYAFNSDKNGMRKDLLRAKSEKFSNVDSTDDTDTVSKSYDIDVGMYDFDNNLVFEKKRTTEETHLDNIDYSLDELMEFNKKKCRKPTVANPFMNPTQNEFNKSGMPSACNADDEEIHNDIVDKFNKDLIMDVSDLFESKNSQRQFYTIPSPNPPDTVQFANALYKSPYTCNTKQDGCLWFENSRHKV